MPITQAIVNKVAAIANHEGMPSGLKIVSKTDNILYNSDWIAGVDPMNNNNNDPMNNDNNDNDKNNATSYQKEDQDYMHPDDIEGLGNAKQVITPNINNEIEEPEIDHKNLNDAQDVHTYEHKDDQSKVVFEPEDNEEDEEETEDDDDPEDDGVLRTR